MSATGDVADAAGTGYRLASEMLADGAASLMGTTTREDGDDVDALAQTRTVKHQ